MTLIALSIIVSFFKRSVAWISLLTGEGVERRERHGQPAEHDVGHGQVDDEYVGDGAHVLVGPHHVNDEHVAEHAQREYEQIDERESGLENVVLDVFPLDGLAVVDGVRSVWSWPGRYVYGRKHVGRDVLQRLEPAAATAVGHLGRFSPVPRL